MGKPHLGKNKGPNLGMSFDLIVGKLKPIWIVLGLGESKIGFEYEFWIGLLEMP